MSSAAFEREGVFCRSHFIPIGAEAFVRGGLSSSLIFLIQFLYMAFYDYDVKSDVGRAQEKPSEGVFGEMLDSFTAEPEDNKAARRDASVNAVLFEDFCWQDGNKMEAMACACLLSCCLCACWLQMLFSCELQYFVSRKGCQNVRVRCSASLSILEGCRFEFVRPSDFENTRCQSSLWLRQVAKMLARWINFLSIRVKFCEYCVSLNCTIHTCHSGWECRSADCQQRYVFSQCFLWPWHWQGLRLWP